MRLCLNWLAADVRHMVAHAGVEPERSSYVDILCPLLGRIYELVRKEEAIVDYVGRYINR